MQVRQATVKYFYLEDPDWLPEASQCLLGEIKTIQVEGFVDPDYGDDQVRVLGEFVETTCIPPTSEAYLYRSNYCPYGLSGVWLTNVELFRFPPRSVGWVHEVREVSLNTRTVPMIGDGGVDVQTISLYDGFYQGGWYATLTVSTFNSALISSDFQANPPKYGFGEYSLGYHGFTVETSQLQQRKTFIPLHTWFPTLEPAGEVLDVNVWLPVPHWERASQIKWHLHPSVKGECTVYWLKLINGMNAYF